MTTVLRVILILMSLLILAVMMRRIRHAKARIEDSMFWVFFALLLVVFSVFPGAADILPRRFLLRLCLSSMPYLLSANIISTFLLHVINNLPH